MILSAKRFVEWLTQESWSLQLQEIQVQTVAAGRSMVRFTVRVTSPLQSRSVLPTLTEPMLVTTILLQPIRRVDRLVVIGPTPLGLSTTTTLLSRTLSRPVTRLSLQSLQII